MPNHSPVVISTAKKLLITRKQTHITQRMACQLWEYHFGTPISQTHLARFEQLQLKCKNLERLVKPMTDFIQVLPGLVEFYEQDIRKPRKRHRKFVRRTKKQIDAEKQLKAEEKKSAMMLNQTSQDHNMNRSDCFSESDLSEPKGQQKFEDDIVHQFLVSNGLNFKNLAEFMNIPLYERNNTYY